MSINRMLPTRRLKMRDLLTLLVAFVIAGVLMFAVVVFCGV